MESKQRFYRTLNTDSSYLNECVATVSLFCIVKLQRIGGWHTRIKPDEILIREIYDPRRYNDLGLK